MKIEVDEKKSKRSTVEREHIKLREQSTIDLFWNWVTSKSGHWGYPCYPKGASDEFRLDRAAQDGFAFGTVGIRLIEVGVYQVGRVV